MGFTLCFASVIWLILSMATILVTIKYQTRIYWCPPLNSTRNLGFDCVSDFYFFQGCIQLCILCLSRSSPVLQLKIIGQFLNMLIFVVGWNATSGLRALREKIDEFLFLAICGLCLSIDLSLMKRVIKCRHLLLPSSAVPPWKIAFERSTPVIRDNSR